MEEKKPVEEKKRKWDLIDKTWSSTIIFSGVVLILLAFLLIRHEVVGSVLAKLWDVMRPIVIGLFIAFILYRPTRQLERFFSRGNKKVPATGIAVTISYFVLFIAIAVIIRIVVPQFIESISDFAGNIMTYYNNAMQLLESEEGQKVFNWLRRNEIDIMQIRNNLEDLSQYIPTAIGTISTWASGFIGGAIDILIGFIFSIYVLAGQNKLKTQGRRILGHYLPQKHYNRIAHYGKLTFTTFSDFISGKIVDSFIIGLIVFIIMKIGGLEYPMMIAVVIGLTNIIPFVGPFIGTIPCALILLMVNPIHAVVFVIIIIIVQQFDCNILTPYIVGTSVGLPAIWVLFAITVGGGLFGVLGMLMGVPVMSVIYTVIREKTSNGEEPPKKPKKKKLWHFVKKITARIRKEK